MDIDGLFTATMAGLGGLGHWYLETRVSYKHPGVANLHDSDSNSGSGKHMLANPGNSPEWIPRKPSNTFHESKVVT